MIKKLALACLFSASALSLYAEEGAPARNPGSFWQTLIMIGVAILFFYFILWRPEQKRRKALESKRSGMQKGDRVVAMGIVGSVDRLKEQTVIVKMVDGTKIEFMKAAITEVQASKEEGSEEDKA